MLLFPRSIRVINPTRTLSSIPKCTMYPTLSQTSYANFTKIVPDLILFKNFVNTLTKKEQNYVFETTQHINTLEETYRNRIVGISSRIEHLKTKIIKPEFILNIYYLELNILKHLYKSTLFYDGAFNKIHANDDVITVSEKFIEIYQSLNDAFENIESQINKIAEEQYCLMIPLSIRENDCVFDPRPNINYTRVRTNIITKKKIIY